MDNERTPPAASADPRVADAWRDHRQRLMDVAYRIAGELAALIEGVVAEL